MKKHTFLVALVFLILATGCTLFQKDDDAVDLPDEIGQWASRATASDAYGGLLGQNRDDQSAYAATGVPDVEACDDSQNAWVASQEDNGIQWLEVGFDTEVYASSVKVRESFGPGAIIKIELADKDDYVTLWEGKDANKKCPGDFEVFYHEKENNITINMTPFMTDRVRITLDTDVKGWNEIDAVGLVGYDKRWHFYNSTLVIE